MQAAQGDHPVLGRHRASYSYAFPRNLIWRDVGPPLNLYDSGFTYVREKTRYTIGYDDVWAVKAHVVVYKLYGVIESGGEQRYDIMTSSRTIRLDERIVRVDDAYRRISEEVLIRLLPRYSHAFDRGELLTFGKFQVTSTVLSYDAKSISWKDLDFIELNNGHLRIHIPPKGIGSTGTPHREAWLHDPTTWAYVPLDEIPNAPILLELIDRTVGLARKR